MDNIVLSKIKQFLAFVLIASVIICMSYLIVYKFSFIPFGFEIEEVHEDYIALKSFNIIGIEKDIMTPSFSENDNWKIFEIVYEVKRQKEFTWPIIFCGYNIIVFINI